MVSLLDRNGIGVAFGNGCKSTATRLLEVFLICYKGLMYKDLIYKGLIIKIYRLAKATLVLRTNYSNNR